MSATSLVRINSDGKSVKVSYFLRTKARLKLKMVFGSPNAYIFPTTVPRRESSNRRQRPRNCSFYPTGTWVATLDGPYTTNILDAKFRPTHAGMQAGARKAELVTDSHGQATHIGLIQHTTWASECRLRMNSPRPLPRPIKSKSKKAMLTSNFLAPAVP